jgi:hypothetical protein
MSESEHAPVIMSFIVKLWLEEITEETGQMIWRGHITHVPSGDRRYLKTVDEIPGLIAPYLSEIGS